MSLLQANIMQTLENGSPTATSPTPLAQDPPANTSAPSTPEPKIEVVDEPELEVKMEVKEEVQSLVPEEVPTPAVSISLSPVPEEKNGNDLTNGESSDGKASPDWRPLRSRSFLNDSQVFYDSTILFTRLIPGRHPAKPFQAKPVPFQVRIVCSRRADRSQQASRSGENSSPPALASRTLVSHKVGHCDEHMCIK